MPEMDEEELYDYEIQRDRFDENQEFFKISLQRLQQIADVAGLTVERTRRICTYPWPDAKIHQRWLDEAGVQEIGHWVHFVHNQESSEGKESQ